MFDCPFLETYTVDFGKPGIAGVDELFIKPHQIHASTSPSSPSLFLPLSFPL
jgi:hypothetical protein